MSAQPSTARAMPFRRGSARADFARLSQERLQPAPILRVVEGKKTKTRWTVLPLFVAATLLFVLTVVVPLVLNTSMAALAYDIRDQRVELAEARRQVQSLEEQLLQARSSTHLQAEAARIGLVPSGSIGVISLEAGTVEGGVPAR